MKRFLLAAALAALPAVASAQATTSIGFTVTSEYVVGGLKQSDGPAFQPYIETQIGGFYVGVWASNVEGTLANTAADNIEIDIYAGYRGEMGSISYDVGYFRYFYDDAGDCCGELIGSISYPVTSALSMTTVLNWDPETDAGGLQQKFNYDLANDFYVSGDVKARNQGGRTSWTLGAGKSFGDFGIDVRYHDNDLPGNDAIYTLGLSWGTSFGG